MWIAWTIDGTTKSEVFTDRELWCSVRENFRVFWLNGRIDWYDAGEGEG